MIADAAAAVAVLVVCGYAAQETGDPSWWQWLLIVAVAATVAVRRKWTLPAAAVALAGSAAVLAAGVIPEFASPGLCAAVALTLYPVGARAPVARSVPVLAAGLAGAAVFGWPAVAVVAAPWLLGRLARHRRLLAEQVFQERTARAVTEERLRIARDMHDTVAHSLSMIAMKASVARHVNAVRPQEGMAALEVIETASRDALMEMRRVVGLLRADEDPAVPDGGEEDLRVLVRRAEEAGVRVEATFAGEGDPPPGVRLVVYRVVQEALTNVVRHARATGCTVAVDAGPESVTVRVTDDGAGAAATDGGGHGLRGMRERVSAYGGSLEAGPRAGGGFAVTAGIPYRAPVVDGRP